MSIAAIDMRLMSSLKISPWLQVRMARPWQAREGTMQAGPNTMTQEEIVEEFRR